VYEIQKLKYVCERDIDLLFLEEVSVNPAFSKFFINSVVPHKNLIFVDAKHSVSNKHGESDLIVIFENERHKKTAVLIENKIDAVFQKKQDYRYKLRGNEGIKAGWWQNFKTCLMASEKYLNKSKGKSFDATFAYEDMQGFFTKEKTSRGNHKAEILAIAINKSKNPYLAQKDEAVTNFHRDYYNYVSQNFPCFDLKEPQDKPSDSSFIHLKSRKYLPNNKIIHKLRFGVFDITSGYAAEDFLKAEKHFNLPTGCHLQIANKKTVIRIIVHKINHKAPFVTQEKNIRNSFYLLLDTLQQIKTASGNI